MTGGWFACPREAWPLVVEGLAKPWPLELAVADLRWWANETRAAFPPVAMPGYRQLVVRWGWGERPVRALLRDEERWRHVRTSAAEPPQERRTPDRENADNGAKMSAPPPRSRRVRVDTRVLEEERKQEERVNPPTPSERGGWELDRVVEVAAEALQRQPALRGAMANGEGWLVRQAQRGAGAWARLPAGLRARTLTAGLRAAAAQAPGPALEVEQTTDRLADWRLLVELNPALRESQYCPVELRAQEEG